MSKMIAAVVAMLAGLALAGCAAPQEVSTKAGAPPASQAEAGGEPESDEGNNVTKVGTWATASDGLAFRVKTLKRGKVGAWATGGNPGDPAAIVTVQIRNTGSKRFDTTMFTIEARVGVDGVTAEEVYDGESFGEGFTGTIAPGRTATQRFMFAASKSSDLKTVSVEITPGYEYESFTFEGSAS